MKIAIPMSYAEDFHSSASLVADYHRAGAAAVFVSEAYTFDGVSQLGYLAAKVPTMEIASDILPIFTRTPSLLAMTAAGLDTLSGGKFTLGLGSSGPGVIKGFHGVDWAQPLGRTREIIAICRQAWSGMPIDFTGRHYTVPLRDEYGNGPRPLKLINTPVRARVPIMLAAMGPQNVALAAELAEKWAPFLFSPEHFEEAWGEPVRRGTARRDPELGPMEIVASVPVAMGEPTEELYDLVRPRLALYIGGMGPRDKNFYADLAARFGFADLVGVIQDLYLSGQKDQAAAAVPRELIDAVGLVGTRTYIAERLAALKEAGVGTILTHVSAVEPGGQTRTIEALADLV
jgi:F420-dependent oxidoreductase-like protein